ncbi:MAG: SDR family NAD(P)-dependent oxidoreductase [Alphaproteobacteria bacterium]
MPTTARNREVPTGRTILITGASSGIGEALALAYADAGTTLALTGRDERRLGAVVSACRDRGSVVDAVMLDVTDRRAMADWIAAIDRDHPLTLVIANAGISGGTGGGGESEAQARAILAVNLDGVLNTIHPALDCMRRRNAQGRELKGQIALMSSLAAFRGFPGAPAYSASKAAVRSYGEALRVELAREGIGVSVICPGFVRSRMTEGNRFRMPFLMDSARAAAIIKRGLAHNRPRIAFPWPTYIGAWLAGALPPSLADPILGALPEKAARDPR